MKPLSSSSMPSASPRLASSSSSSSVGALSRARWWVAFRCRQGMLGCRQCCFRLRRGRAKSDVRMRRCVCTLLLLCMLGAAALFGLTLMGPPPKEQQEKALEKRNHMLNLRIEIPILTVATKSSMANLREFVGMVHRYCPRCPITIYSFDLTETQLSEVAKWERVDLYDVVRDLLLKEPFYSTLNPIQLAIVHALQGQHRVLYVDVSLEFTGTLEPVDEALQRDGYVFVHDDSNPKFVSGSVQGYTKASEAYVKVAKALVSPTACKTPKKPCRTGRVIRLPSRSRNVHELSDLRLQAQDLQSVTVTMKILSEANANVDKNNVAAKLKPYHEELESYADTHRCFIRFDVSEITGEVIEAELILHAVWVADTKMQPTEAYADLLFVSDNSWDERSLDWVSKPSSGDLISTWKCKTGDDVAIDVTEQIKRAARKDKSHYRARKVSFALISRDWNWVKYTSRHGKRQDQQPRLIVKVRGQGVGYRYVHSVLSHKHFDGAGVDDTIQAGTPSQLVQ